AEFTTFDGLKLLVRVGSRAVEPAAEDDAADDEVEHWITVEASADDAVADAPEPGEGEEPSEAAQPSEGEAPESGQAGADAEAAAPGEEEAGEETPDPHEEAARINDRVSGWTYRIADYKAEQLTRRLTDLLSEEEDAAAE